jgi:hypothetical protein
MGGGFKWSIRDLLGAEQRRKGWADAVFADPDDAYGQVWHNKLGFLSIANGDSLAFDLAHGPDYPVVYLSHDDGVCHGYTLGESFVAFMDRWTLLGCPGPETWVLEAFVPSRASGIDPDCENGRKWREWLGLE